MILLSAITTTKKYHQPFQTITIGSAIIYPPFPASFFSQGDKTEDTFFLEHNSLTRFVSMVYFRFTRNYENSLLKCEGSTKTQLNNRTQQLRLLCNYFSRVQCQIYEINKSHVEYKNGHKKTVNWMCETIERRKCVCVCHIPVPHGTTESLYSQMFVVGKIIIGLWSVFKNWQANSLPHSIC